MDAPPAIHGRQPDHPPAGHDPNLWGIVLAAGDGKRVAHLTEKLAGRSCPKQFCTIIGKRSLLQHTLHRAERLIPPERILTVVSPAHWKEIQHQLADRPAGTLLFQPANRETGPGILFPLVAIHKRDPEAIIAIFPADHFILEEERFMASVRLATLAVKQDPAWLVLLGVKPEEPETEYGWIKVGKVVGCYKGEAIHEVRQFWEKPDRRIAEWLLAAGALWNSLVVVVKAKTLLTMARCYLPQLFAPFWRIREALGRPEEQKVLAAEYERMPSVAFSRGLLEQKPPNLVVLPVKGVLWSDWGNAARILKTLERMGRLSDLEAQLQERGHSPERVSPKSAWEVGCGDPVPGSEHGSGRGDVFGERVV